MRSQGSRKVLEKEERSVDRTLKQLREAISNKRRNVDDLRRVLEDDFAHLLKVPRYVYVLWAIHFFLVQQFWCNLDGPAWLANVVMLLWLHRRWYRPIHNFAFVLSIVLICISVAFGARSMQ